MRFVQCLRVQRISKLTATLLFCNMILFPLLLYSESEHGRKKKHSVTELRLLADKMNSVRLNKALQYLRHLNASQSQRFYEENLAKPTLDLVVSIPTVSRATHLNHNKVGYLIQTAAMFDQLLKKDKHFGGKMLFICNTDRTPKQHSEAAILQEYLPFVQLYGNSTSKSVPLTENIAAYRKGNANKYSKETFDYIFCLKTALQYKSKYILMAEDDALPREELLVVLNQLLLKQNGRFEEPKKRKPFLLIKLYYPERWLGYANEFGRLIELAGVGLFGWGLFAFLFGLFWKRKYCETVIVATLGGLCLLLLALLLGRQKVMELRRLSSHLYFVRKSPDCCTPAVIYRTEYVHKLIHYLLSGTYDSTRPLDIAMAEYSRSVSQNQSSLYVEPNLFRHIGMYSSLDKGPKDPNYFLFQ